MLVPALLQAFCMGIGHKKQFSFFKTDWQHFLCHGGSLRQKRKGRGMRPLSTKEPLHVVFKVNKSILRHKSLRSYSCFFLINKLIEKYSQYFHVKIEQISIQADHVHLLLRTSRRSQFHNFFRVLSGQIAQRFKKAGLLKNVTDTPNSHKVEQSLWKYRPFSRVIRGYKAYKTARNYIQLNEKEALQEIPYQKNRLRGLSTSDWQILWS